MTATIAGVPLRLRVMLDGRGGVELNRAAAARLPLAFEDDEAAQVGRVPLAGITAAATLTIAGKPVPAALWSFGTCCEGADGAIDATLLPFAAVRLVRPTGATGEARTWVLRRNAEYGMAAREMVAGRAIDVRFALDRPETLATASAGAMLAKAWSGRFADGYAPVAVAWGVSRPSRTIAFASGGRLGGFRFDAVRTRTADLAGRDRLPTDPVEANEIVVTRRTARHRGAPAVAIGRDRIDACGEIALDTQSLLLTLRCDFAR